MVRPCRGAVVLAIATALLAHETRASQCDDSLVAIRKCFNSSTCEASAKSVCGDADGEQVGLATYLGEVVERCSSDEAWPTEHPKLKAEATKAKCPWPEDDIIMIIIGVCLSVGGCFSNVIGLNFVRMSHEILRKRDADQNTDLGDLPESPKPDMRGSVSGGDGSTEPGEDAGEDGEKKSAVNPFTATWQFPVGWFMSTVMVGSCDGISLGFAPLEVLAPVSGTSVVVNMGAAQIVNKEKLLVLDMIVACLIIPGVIMTSIFGPHHSAHITMPFIVHQLARWQFILFEVVIWSTLGGIMVLASKMHQKSESGIWSQNKAFMATHPGLKIFGPGVYMFCAAVFGAHQLLASKIVVECIKTTAGGDNMFLTPLPYLAVPCLATWLPMQLAMINRSLSIYGALQSVPMFNALFLLMSSSVSAMFFQTLEQLPWTNLIGYFVGISSVASGVLLILKRPAPIEKEKQGANGESLLSPIPMKEISLADSDGVVASTDNPVAGDTAMSAPGDDREV